MNSAAHNIPTHKMAPNQANQPNQQNQAIAPRPVMMFDLDALECVIARIMRDGVPIIRPVPRGILRELQFEHGRDIQLMPCYCPVAQHQAGQQCGGCGHQMGDLHCACPQCQQYKQ